MTDFARTREALRLFDTGRTGRQRRWDAADTQEEVDEAVGEGFEADKLVHDAFYADTKEFNTRENCALVDPDDSWLRRTVSVGAMLECVVS